VTLYISVPRIVGDPLNMEFKRGGVAFVLGANGTGKSSLMQHLSSANEGRVERILAHRQTWFQSLSVSLSPANYAQTQHNVRVTDINPQTRWQDNYAGARSEVSLYKLIESHNNRARKIAEAADIGNDSLVYERVRADAPLPLTNRLLRSANINVRIFLDEEGALKASKADSAPFSYAQLSDGERNALVIMASVLTAAEGTLFLIDEPERHLHRSIISPLLTQLFAQRPDCYFIISTHEVELPIDAPDSRTLLVRDVVFFEGYPSAWDIDVMDNAAPGNDSLRRDILGARRSILFVEGESNSLDVPLYSLLFPQVSVVPKSSCRDVEQAVRGIRSSSEFHWVQAFGIVDNDNRPQGELAALQTEGIYPLSVYSVESVYYHPDIIQLVATRLSKAQGFDVQQATQHALDGILEAVNRQSQHLVERVVDRQAREQVARQLPTIKTVQAGEKAEISVDIPGLLRTEQAHLATLMSNRDVAAIVARYPIRETPAFSAVARAVRLTDSKAYVSTVRAMMADTPEARSTALALFSTLPTDLLTASETRAS
jgi:ABC-type cobalamin/Fe3+-siderophores transport system ATPase subunit